MSISAIRRVPYQIPGSPSWQWVSIYTRLSQERIIFLNQPISTGLANSLVAAMLYLDSEDNTKPIYLYINSLGDPVEAGMANESAGLMSINATLAIYDTMQHIKSEVATICLGQAMGTAALLLAAGTKGKRACLPHASIALYQPRVGTQGQATDIQVNAQEALQKKTLMLEIFSNVTGQPIEKIRKDIDRMFYMTPEAAQTYGIVDRVIPA